MYPSKHCSISNKFSNYMIFCSIVVQERKVTTPSPICNTDNIEKLIVAYEICLSNPIKYLLSFKLHFELESSF